MNKYIQPAIFIIAVIFSYTIYADYSLTYKYHYNPFVQECSWLFNSHSLEDGQRIKLTLRIDDLIQIRSYSFETVLGKNQNKGMVYFYYVDIRDKVEKNFFQMDTEVINIQKMLTGDSLKKQESPGIVSTTKYISHVLKISSKPNNFTAKTRLELCGKWNEEYLLLKINEDGSYYEREWQNVFSKSSNVNNVKMINYNLYFKAEIISTLNGPTNIAMVPN